MAGESNSTAALGFVGASLLTLKLVEECTAAQQCFQVRGGEHTVLKDLASWKGALHLSLFLAHALLQQTLPECFAQETILRHDFLQECKY